MTTTTGNTGAVTHKWLSANYSKKEIMIPMRDGVSLYTAVYIPVTDAPRPVIMLRTPYPLSPYGKTFARNLRTIMRNFVLHRYIIVYQNVRGTYLSEGDFVNIRPLDPAGIDEATDTYDTAEWLLKHLNTNGNIGVKGTSYPGFYATMAALSRHPAIKAVSPQAPVTDWFMGDDAHMHGAFQYSLYTFGNFFFRPRKKPGIRSPRPLVDIDGDYYDHFNGKAISDILDTVGKDLPFLAEMREHPTYDQFWSDRNPARHLHDIRSAVLIVGGWYDTEDPYGPLETYRQLRRLSPNTPAYLVQGPWYHGTWRKNGIEASTFLDRIEYPFFAHYLDNSADTLPTPVLILPSGDSSLWRHLPSWPAPGTRQLKLFCSDHNTLADTPSSASCSYTSDPSHPIPFTATVPSSGWPREAAHEDQRPLTRRPDLLTFTSAPLTETLRAEGPVSIHLELAISTTDADMVIKLIDRHPDGTEQLVRYGVKPVRFRDSMSHPAPATPGKPFTMEFNLNDIGHHFLPGHRIMAVIQSSLFPLVAMNPQTFLGNPLYAKKEDYRPCDVILLSGTNISLTVSD